MIISLIIRHYKCYKGLNYIPITDIKDNNLSIYIGDNGVGKSSILEAINTFFNNGQWNRTKDTKQDETFISPVYLIEKIHLKNFDTAKNKDLEVLETISDYFWNEATYSGNKEVEGFFEQRDKLSTHYDSNEYFLFTLGSTFKDKNKAYFGSPFDNSVVQILDQKHPHYQIDNLINLLRNYYSFIYIPVESKMSETLRLETFEMQKLMNKDILNEIDSVLKDKQFKKPKGTAKINAVEYLNLALNEFMDEINSQVQNLNKKYSFKVDAGFKKNLTPYDLREKILEAYFSIRTLKRDGKEIFQLSSGEQRIALIDIATAFINADGDKEGNLILAIDEPEASMHISNCFSQFKRLENIAKQKNLQLLLTTHWYGSLPTIQRGKLHHIEADEKPKITSFDFLNYLEENGNFPDDIELKSFFELVSTIISSIKNEEINWIICEGSDDKLYIETYLKNRIDNLQVLAVGGIGNVIKLYEYLFVPFSEKREKKLLKDGKVLCIIDSDQNQKTIKVDSQSGNSLAIRRIQLNNDDYSHQLVRVGGQGNYIITSMEDCLSPNLFYKALDKTITENSEKEIIDIFKEFKKTTSPKHSKIKGEDSLIEPKKVSALKNKDMIYDEISKISIKYKLAENYKSLLKKSHKRPEIFDLIEEFFSD